MVPTLRRGNLAQDAPASRQRHAGVFSAGNNGEKSDGFIFLVIGQYDRKNSNLRSEQALFRTSGCFIVPRFNKVPFRIPKVHGYSVAVGTPTWHRSFLDHNAVGLESLDQILPRLFAQRETEMIQIAAPLPARGTLLPHLFWK